MVDVHGNAPVNFLDATFDGPHGTHGRMRKLLVNAPADRAWRRRDYLVLCRAYPERVQLKSSVAGGQSDAGMARKTGDRASQAKAKAGGCISNRTAAGRLVVVNGHEFGRLAGGVVGLEEDGVFRTIVGYFCEACR